MWWNCGLNEFATNSALSEQLEVDVFEPRKDVRLGEIKVGGATSGVAELYADDLEDRFD